MQAGIAAIQSGVLSWKVGNLDRSLSVQRVDAFASIAATLRR
ncbi:MAG: hypothetical protein PHD91_00095 [bacterium]|nr:hypothetical protein [bacterium]MDD3804777.1 hypothetical protein [bacterium]MDD4152106.1 hypothetical protein [bacterium]MDD4557589.1 hypothetical protein [bacterium]